MKYKLNGENVYSNWRIAEFIDLDILLKFIKDNPMPHPEKDQYIILIESKSHARFTVNKFLKHVENNPKKYSGLVQKECKKLSDT